MRCPSAVTEALRKPKPILGGWFASYGGTRSLDDYVALYWQDVRDAGFALVSGTFDGQHGLFAFAKVDASQIAERAGLNKETCSLIWELDQRHGLRLLFADAKGAFATFENDLDDAEADVVVRAVVQLAPESIQAMLDGLCVEGEIIDDDYGELDDLLRVYVQDYGLRIWFD